LCGELTDDFGGAFEATSIDGCRLFCRLAEIWAARHFGTFATLSPHKQTSSGRPAMSEKCHTRKSLFSFDYLVGAAEQRWRHRQIQRLSSFEVNGEHKPDRLFDR
jgi:hypothetical protein